MEKQNYSYGFEHAIKTIIQKLLILFKSGEYRAALIKGVKEKLSMLENANGRFMDCLHSVSAKLKMSFYLLICGMCIPIDFALLFNSLSVLCSH